MHKIANYYALLSNTDFKSLYVSTLDRNVNIAPSIETKVSCDIFYT